MIPPTMTMPEPFDFIQESSLALQHVRRIRDVLPGFSVKSEKTEHIDDVQDPDELDDAKPAMDDGRVYQGLIAWFTSINQLHRLIASITANFATTNTYTGFKSKRGDVGATKAIMEPLDRPPVLFVVPTALPKAASVEIQSLLYQDNMSDSSTPDDTDEKVDSSSYPENHFSQASDLESLSDPNPSPNSIAWRTETHKASERHAFHIIWFQSHGRFYRLHWRGSLSTKLPF